MRQVHSSSENAASINKRFEPSTNTQARNFEKLTKKLVRVPKSEIDAERAKKK